MTVQRDRGQAIHGTMASIKDALAGGVTIADIDQAKANLVALARKRELFPKSEFPTPTHDQKEYTYRLYEDPDGRFALYAYAALSGFTTGPHDHGGAWAIVAAIEGNERHFVYRRTDDGSVADRATVEAVAEIMVEGDQGISLLEDGIHSIEASNDDPILHLHCYGLAFELQTNRKNYHMETGTYVISNDVGLVENMPQDLGGGA